MRGQAELEAMRRRGYVPEAVFIETDRRPAHRLDAAFDPVRDGLAHLELSLGESPKRVDLRCVIGLTVHVSGTDAGVVHAVRDAAVKARAQRVIATVCAQTPDSWPPYRTTELTDTSGVDAWPSERVAAYSELAQRIAFYRNRSRNG